MKKFGYVRYYDWEGKFCHGSYFPSQNSVKHDLVALTCAVHWLSPEDPPEFLKLRNGELIESSSEDWVWDNYDPRR